MVVRSILTVNPAIPNPMMAAGMINCWMFNPKFSVMGIYLSGGDHPHHKGGKTKTMVASQKVGIATAMMEKLRAR
jgi:hypothetical protein